MKFITLVDNFKKVTSICDKISFKKSNIPILENILIEVVDKKIKISATDLEVGYIANLQGKTEEEGKVAVNTKTLNNFLNNFSEEKIEIEKKDNTLLIKTQDSKTLLPTTNPDEFPLIPKVQSKDYLEIDSNALIKALNQAINTVATQEIRPEITGVLFKLNEDNLKLVSTDSFRLSEAVIFKENLTIKTDKEINFIIPKKVIQLILQSLNETNKKVKINFDKNQAFFEINDHKFISRLIEGKFPEYQDLIPNSFLTSFYISKKLILSALKIASIFTSRISEVNLSLAAKEGNLKISSKNELQGNFEKDVKIKIDGDSLKINFNINFLIQGLENVFGDEIFFGFNKENQPLLIKSVQDPSYLYIVMPLKV